MHRSSPIRVLIVDDHVLMRTGLRTVLDGHAGLQVVGEIDSRDSVNGIVSRVAPEVIVFDLDDDNALAALSQCLTSVEHVPIVALSGVREHESHQEAVRLGVRGLVLKVQDAEVLVKAIQKVHSGELWFSRSLMAQVLGKVLRPAPVSLVDAPLHTSLTDREREVITLLCQGLKNQQIGARLHISESTVRHHLTSIYSKLDLSDRLELLIYAYKHGLVQPPS